MASSKTTRTLKIWNGRGHGKYANGHIFVAAYTKKQAVEIINESCNSCISTNEITNYFSPCWGNPMNGIVATEPCVYVSERAFQREHPKRIY